MAIKAECDRCGAQEPAPEQIRVLPGWRVLPKAWERVIIQAETEGVQGERKELCPACVAALRLFFEGDGAVPGLLEPATLDAVVRPEDAGRALWPVPDAEPEPQGCIAHGGPDCICLTDVEVEQQKWHPDTPHDFVGDEDTCTVVRACPVTWGEFRAWKKSAVPVPVPLWGTSPEPEPEHEMAPEEEDEGREHEHDFGPGNMARCACGSMYSDVLARTEALNGPVSFAGADPAAPFGQRIPVGSKTAPCPEGGRGLCAGVYTRGALHQHMQTEHGIKLSSGSDGCPFCPEICTISLLGSHIAQQHPGDWQAWVDSRGGEKG